MAQNKQQIDLISDSENQLISHIFKDIPEINGKNKDSTHKNNEKLSHNSNENIVKSNGLTTSPHKESELNSDITVEVERMGFEEFEQIGVGSYGHVFKANSVKLQKEVAVKVIDLKRFAELFRKKFLSVELELIRQLKQQENVVKFYDTLEDKDNHLILIVMEFYPNGDLFDYIERHFYIPERESSLWFRQLICGVEHIHSSGYAHRDLKCENLLLDSKFNIKIIDFGFCCRIRYQKLMTAEEEYQIQNTTKEIPSVTYCGSVLYASPELLRGQSYYPTKTDVWSCGIILYFMLFGCFPNEGNQLYKFIRQDMHTIEVPGTPKVSEECKQLFGNILIDEKHRYDIKQIKDSIWFKKQWPPIDQNITNEEHFGRLNIERQETLSFGYIEENQTE